MSYEEWMKSQKLSKSTIKKYSGAIQGVLSEWALNEGITAEPLVSINNISAFNSICLGLTKLAIFKERNNTGHNMYSRALATYSEYLSELSNEDIKKDTEVLPPSNIRQKDICNLLKNGQKVFLNKMWGFSPETHPFVGFSTKGARNKYLRESKRGDWLIVMGTRSMPTKVEEQGCFLGLCQLGHDKINAIELLKEMGTEVEAHEIDKHGDYKWPWAMPILRAYRIAQKADCSEFLGSYLPGQHWATYAVNLEEHFNSTQIEEILNLPISECLVPEVPALQKQLIFADTINLNKKSGPTGPPPSANRSSSNRDQGEGFAYAFKFIGPKKSIFKIGMSKNTDERLKQLNKEIRPNLTDCSWKPFMKQKFLSEGMAYNFEQLLLKYFVDKKIEGEEEIILVSENELKSVWGNLFFEKKWVSS